MKLPPPQPRQMLHERRVITRGFLRDDGLWDIEGEIVDEKGYDSVDRERGTLPAGTPYHNMCARLTVDNELKIHEVATSMPATPFAYCPGANDPTQLLVGKSLTRGFRRAVDDTLGGVRSCTHLRDLILSMATTAYQTIFSYQSQFMPDQVDTTFGNDTLPFFINRCRTWAESTPVVAKYYPKYYHKP
ncbi:hypothetical protein BLA18110_06225 [Burkholderia lata]|uniref:DUF2889 domain-containing protein n=1 Tax=Burkholderia lata (strain ATCC 17760 / DSM 23089 / LMG 22485 / NCIMB 9086 / R18194 / 383) TaxID=482957 RepID=UPI001453D296|nr:DUF2889 domain-containing protein [Burkholderia lata]VWD32162.1 hypothetical protein BLA18110_06225 [Burkholderia lata]